MENKVLEDNSLEQREKAISELMNLIGYGLAKFSMDFVKEFGFSTKTAFNKYIVSLGFAKTEKAVSNRQDSFDPYFDNGRKGWYQRNQREHIKLFIDSLFGNENVKSYSNIVKAYIAKYSTQAIPFKEKIIIAPTIETRFKQLQETGKEAEFYFMSNFKTVPLFVNGFLEDARMLGDGYDFQIKTEEKFFLAEVKGIKEQKGAFRMTQKEYQVASNYKTDYILIIVSNMIKSPKISYFSNPLERFKLQKREIQTIQTNYHSETLNW